MANAVGPFFVDGKERFFCLKCDADEQRVQEEYPDGVTDNTGCVLEELTGKTVTVSNLGSQVNWDLLDDDPYPRDDHPNITNKVRRFVCYKGLAAALGASGTRMVLPVCCTDAILDQFPASAAEPTVGFQG